MVRKVTKQRKTKKGDGIKKDLFYWKLQQSRRRAGLPFETPDGGIAIYDYTAPVAAFLQANGHKKVLRVTLCRSPVMGVVSKVMSLVTLGGWDEKKRELGYTDMFHVWALLFMDTGEKFWIEKNQTILAGNADLPENRGYYLNPKDHLTLQVPVMKTLDEMVSATRSQMGTERFFDYRGYDWNCQDFLLNFVDANGLSTPEAQEFLHQDTQQMFDSLGLPYKILAKAATDVAGFFDFLKGKISWL